MTFCGDSYLATPNACKSVFCSTYSNKQTCLSEIGAFQDGWQRFYCSQNVLNPPYNPSDCTGLCLQCIYDISDFGWKEAISRWGNYNQGGSGNTGTGGNCVSWTSLPTSLTTCQDGVTLQYLSTDTLDENGNPIPGGCWLDVIAIPSGVTICEKEIVFNSENTLYKPLFTNQLRLQQCNNDALCSTSNTPICNPIIGFNAQLSIVPQDVSSDISRYWQLVREGILVCDKSSPNCLTDAYPGGELAVVKCIDCENCST